MEEKLHAFIILVRDGDAWLAFIIWQLSTREKVPLDSRLGAPSAGLDLMA
jgi:hypothetical protein